MADPTPTIDIIRTKLHRPPVARDLVRRTQLLERLDYHRQRPLTLVSAPAGYGKSTLVSHWLETCDCPGAWLSLDPDDNDLRQFLIYLVAAVQTVFPEAMQHTLTLLNAPELPSVLVLLHNLVNELDQIEPSLLLALDDYQLTRQCYFDVWIPACAGMTGHCKMSTYVIPAKACPHEDGGRESRFPRTSET